MEFHVCHEICHLVRVPHHDFTHDIKFVTIDQLKYHEPDAKGTLDNIISRLQNNAFPQTEVGPGIINNSTLLKNYQGAQPIIP